MIYQIQIHNLNYNNRGENDTISSRYPWRYLSSQWSW